MIIYYLYILYCWIVSFFNANSKNLRKKLSYLLWFGLFFIMAFRADTVGNDLVRYLGRYKHIDYEKFMFSEEPGYVLFQKMLSFFHVGPQGFIIIVSLIISSSFAWFFYKYSKNITSSFILHLTVGLFAFSMTGLRQILAICLTMFALHFAIKRKLILFILLTLLASTFHTSALIFLPVYFILGMPIISYKSVFLLVLFVFISIFINQYLFTFIGDIAIDKYSENYIDVKSKSTMNILYITFQLFFLVSVILFWIAQKSKIKDISKEDLSFFWLAIIGAVFTVISVNLSVVNRLSTYFFTYTLILVVNTIDRFKHKQTKEILLFLIVALGIIFFSISTPGGISKIDNYRFFWE